MTIYIYIKTYCWYKRNIYRFRERKFFKTLKHFQIVNLFLNWGQTLILEKGNEPFLCGELGSDPISKPVSPGGNSE